MDRKKKNKKTNGGFSKPMTVNGTSAVKKNERDDRMLVIMLSTMQGHHQTPCVAWLMVSSDVATLGCECCGQ